MQYEPEENGIFEEADIIETTDEDGQVHVFEKVSELEVDGQEYALLIYKGTGDGEKPESKDGGEETEDDDEVVVMRISYEDGLEVYEAIEDEAEFERVIAAIETLDDGDDDSPITIDLSNFVRPDGDVERN
jgi:hypothetical protein